MRRGSRGFAWQGTLAACALSAACLAPAAQATVTAEVVPAKDGKGAGTLKITGDGDGDLVYLDHKDGLFNIADPGKDPKAGSGCQDVPMVNEVTCGSALASAYVNLGEGDNILNVFQTSQFSGDLTVTYIGGSGTDNVDGGQFTREIVDGGAGNDTIGTGGSFGNKDASEVLKGGAGNDHLTGGSGPDLLDGGGGQDTMRGDVGAETADDGVDHIDASETRENGETDSDLLIDCGGTKEDSYQKDDRDLVLQTILRNCENEKNVTVELAGAGDPSAGANPVKPDPKEAIKAAVEAVIKATPEISGKISIPSGGKPKGKTAAKSAKATVVPIRARTLKLRPGVERVIEIDLSKPTERAILRSLRKGGRPTLSVSLRVRGAKGAANRDSAKIAFGL